MILKDKTALITGASSGIGKSYAYLLAEEGMNLILVARSKDALETISEDIRSKHSREVHVIQKDLSELDAAESLHHDVKDLELEVDLLINNAGFGKWGKFESFSWEEYQQMVHLNVTTLTELCYCFLEDLKKRPEAGIINVGSTASFIPIPYSAVYGATKAYVLSFTEALTGELAETNVRVFCLCPGGTDTNFSAVADTDKKASKADLKWLSPDEVAKIGLDEFQVGKHYTITGRKGQLKVMKLLPRKKVIDLVGNYWKKLLGI